MKYSLNLGYKLGEYFKLDKVSFLTGNGCSIYAGSKSTMDFKIADMVNEDGYKDIADVIKHIQGLGMEKQLDALLTIQKYYQLTKDKREAITGNLIDALSPSQILCKPRERNRIEPTKWRFTNEKKEPNSGRERTKSEDP